ncbi:MAG: filamentous hemagglutinin N-terminal domain-containing protein [Nitrospira sp.]|nr:filamentous hemagglutinin N-terminal domain-containing protein [Nitrospira sp.]
MNCVTLNIEISARNLLTIVFSMVLVWPSFKATNALAQVPTTITPTTGSGDLGTTVAIHDHTIQITGGTRPNNGTNLFHSFEQFSVGRPDTAQFLNTTPSIPTSNILSRVTGGNPSSILGAIDTMSYPGANLFLMNPAGIVFGPNATLNVSGSVAFTTADYLRLANTDSSNAGIFHATPTITSLLTNAPVAAFGFLDANTPAAIALNGSTLAVQPSRSITLVGGNISVQSGTPENGTVPLARLSAPGGQINMASVVSPGEILANTLDKTQNINGQSFGPLGTVEISKNSTVDTSGAGGGTVLIRGGRLIVDDSTISANSTAGHLLDPSWQGIGIEIEVAQDATISNSAIVETNVEAGAQHESGGVRITADHITISGGPKIFARLNENPPVFLFSGIRSNVGVETKGPKSGDISLNANSSIKIKDLGQIETKTESEGNAGHIILNASEHITLDLASVVSNSDNSSGNAGNITVSSDQGNVSLLNTPFLESSTTKNSSGNTGNITIDARRGEVLLVNSNIFNSNNGNGTLGNIQVNARDLTLQDGSKIGGDNLSSRIPGSTTITLENQLNLAGGSAINTGAFGQADSADLIISAPDILITGKESGLFTNTFNSGNGGRLRLSTDNLQLADGGVLSSKSKIGGVGIIPSGHGGVISIEGYKNPGASITINGPGSGIFTSAEGTGPAGDIDVRATSVTIQNGGKISAETTGTSSNATGGSIIITATDQVMLKNGASISASSTGPADAGNIFVDAGRQLDLQDSSITTEAKQASGGNIEIKAVDLIRVANGSISSSVQGGPSTAGGNITIDPKAVVLQNAQVLASAQQGSGGNIMITTPLFLTDPRSVVDASSQFGLNGSVTIQSPTSNLSETVGQLASKTSPPQVLLQNRCVALAGGEQSTFILAGRDALPSQPGGWLSSPVAMEHWTGDNMEEHASGLMVRRIEPRVSSPEMSQVQGTEVLSLRRLTPSGFLVRSFADRALTGCRS